MAGKGYLAAKPLGSFQSTIKSTIRHHGVVMLKLTPTKS